MVILYTISIYFLGFILHIVALFNPKIRLFINGRKDVFDILQSKIAKNQDYVWVHVASLGEFEQGLPVIKELRKHYKIVVTFFSPSGYEVRKNSPEADVIVYLPLDTPRNTRKFIDIIQPKMAVFVKYEFWYHYLITLKKRNVPTFLLSGIFREKQIFFKPYGGMMRNALHCFSHFFVQNQKSKQLLQSIGFENITVSGDTRFDRVTEILHRDNHLDFIEKFVGNSLCVVFGSSWEEDESIYVDIINSGKENVKYIIAPHDIHTEKINALREKIHLKSVLFSEKKDFNTSDFQVYILDTVGILTKVYSYADIAYVGGGMGNSGLHNVLEPAVFGIPVIIGKNYEKFNEAKELVEKGGVISVDSSEKLQKILFSLIDSPIRRAEIGNINRTYIQNQSGATQKFMNFVKKTYVNQIVIKINTF
ncbi:3-deoxy-D-manno-octulosonic acid transferase [Capnocytophaga canis]|uniref:3-deoxy-D-manno-octulosonic acid transferase n=1 Tax=Capnocytophaga canis TaxID=1848903 RepID=UPI00370DAFB3